MEPKPATVPTEEKAEDERGEAGARPLSELAAVDGALSMSVDSASVLLPPSVARLDTLLVDSKPRFAR